jgi:hypothetical protein
VHEGKCRLPDQDHTEKRKIERKEDKEKERWRERKIARKEDRGKAVSILCLYEEYSFGVTSPSAK